MWILQILVQCMGPTECFEDRKTKEEKLEGEGIEKGKRGKEGREEKTERGKL